MSLRMRRNLPTLILLGTILLAALLLLGSQPLIAYTVKAIDPAAVESASVLKSLAGLFLIEKAAFLPVQ